MRLGGGLAAAGAIVPIQGFERLLPQQSEGGSAGTRPSALSAVPTTFGRMFPGLPAATWPLADLDLLAARVMADEEDEPTPENEVDDEENLNIDAGLTYVGQFIDHDLTLDERPDDLVTPVTPESILNGRTASFDLDSLYGAGPTGSPELYEADGVRLKIGAALTGSADTRARDLPRGSDGRALTGDARNDENKLVAGVHSVFIRFHNLVVAGSGTQGGRRGRDRLAQAQRAVRHYYQWAVLTDFLSSLVGDEMMRSVLPGFPDRREPTLKFFPSANGMPVEFSVAAYRVGHSMVRPVYRINDEIERLPVFTSTFDPASSLVGFSPSPSNFGIDWSRFFSLGAERTQGSPQTAYKFDNSLVFPLSLLPLPATGAGPASLAKRNLMRAVQLGLPSGQGVARAMGVEPLRDDQILIGKATGNADDTTPITEISAAFAGSCPLWTYVLAESVAQTFNVSDGRIVGQQQRPMRLGPVGGRIVAETFVGLMAANGNSILNDRNFRPRGALAPDGTFGFSDLFRVVMANG